MFIGFAIGTLCLIGLVRAVARRRGYGMPPWGCGYEFAGHHGGFGGHRRGFGRHHGFGQHDAWDEDSPPFRSHREGRWGRKRRLVDSILGRLDVSPAQEKAILAAIDELEDKTKELRGIGRDVRADVARAIRGPMLDDVALEGATARIDDATLKLRAAARAAIAKIHEVLDDRQRTMLADMIDSNWRGGW
jgi:hypothetical protein